MANSITFGANITPPSTAMEVTINGGATFTALAFTTVGGSQQGILTNVPAGTYAVGSVGLRAVGYANTTTSYNTLYAITIASTAPAPTPSPAPAATYNTAISILAGGAAATASGVTLSGPVGSKLEFNTVASTGALPVHLDLLIAGSMVAGLDFEDSYIPNQFRFTTAAGVVYSGSNNTFQNLPSGLTLS